MDETELRKWMISSLKESAHYQEQGAAEKITADHRAIEDALFKSESKLKPDLWIAGEFFQAWSNDRKSGFNSPDGIRRGEWPALAANLADHLLDPSVALHPKIVALSEGKKPGLIPMKEIAVLRLKASAAILVIVAMIALLLVLAYRYRHFMF